MSEESIYETVKRAEREVNANARRARAMRALESGEVKGVFAGLIVRLWPDNKPEHDTMEVHREDAVDTILELREAGDGD